MSVCSDPRRQGGGFMSDSSVSLYFSLKPRPIYTCTYLSRDDELLKYKPCVTFSCAAIGTFRWTWWAQYPCDSKCAWTSAATITAGLLSIYQLLNIGTAIYTAPLGTTAVRQRCNQQGPDWNLKELRDDVSSSSCGPVLPSLCKVFWMFPQ